MNSNVPESHLVMFHPQPFYLLSKLKTPDVLSSLTHIVASLSSKIPKQIVVNINSTNYNLLGD
jgi:hypothetical protein